MNQCTLNFARRQHNRKRGGVSVCAICDIVKPTAIASRVAHFWLHSTAMDSIKIDTTASGGGMGRESIWLTSTPRTRHLVAVALTQPTIQRWWPERYGNDLKLSMIVIVQEIGKIFTYDGFTTQICHWSPDSRWFHKCNIFHCLFSFLFDFHLRIDFVCGSIAPAKEQTWILILSDVLIVVHLHGDDG